MGISQRNKGQRGERELFGMLSDELGFVVKRNIDQIRAGGADCIEIPGWAVECKRCETLNINAWWAQAEGQAEKLTSYQNRVLPILFYRQARQPWKAVINLNHILARSLHGKTHMAIIGFETACGIIRESLA